MILRKFDVALWVVIVFGHSVSTVWNSCVAALVCNQGECSEACRVYNSPVRLAECTSPLVNIPEHGIIREMFVGWMLPLRPEPGKASQWAWGGGYSRYKCGGRGGGKTRSALPFLQQLRHQSRIHDVRVFTITSAAARDWTQQIRTQNSYMQTKMAKHWWKNTDMVRQELEMFCEANNLDKSVLPSTSQLRIYPGGNHLIHAVQMHGGIGNLSKALGLRQATQVGAGAGGAGAVRGGGSALTIKENAGRRRQPPTTPHTSTDAGHAPETTPYGYFSDRERFRDELIAFGQLQTNNAYWKVLPSSAQLRRSGRMDLARAIHRYGGSTAVAARFGMLCSTEYAYINDFYSFLRELKAYQLSTKQVGKMPSLKSMLEDGRPDLVRSVRKHGGMNVLAARLFLALDSERKEVLKWGVFDLDFAIDILNVSQVLALEMGSNGLMLLPTEPQLRGLGRADLHDKVVKYGGREDVARRLGMDSHVFPRYS